MTDEDIGKLAELLETMAADIEALWIAVWGADYKVFREAAHVTRLLATPGDKWRPGDQERVDRWYAEHPQGVKW